MVIKAAETNPRAGKIQSGMSKSMQDKKEFQKQLESVPKVEEKSILVARELKLVKSLAGNDVKLRRKVLKNLKIWLATRSRSSFAFTDTDFLRLWKGLFYCMWMSDKPLVQENLADEIASLVRCFDDLSVALQYFGTFLETMCIEWFGIDHWRMDKFMMLVRRCTRQMLMVLHESEWPKEHVSAMMKHIEKTILDTDKAPFGLTKHFDDLLLEEIAKVSDGEIEPEVVHIIVNSYALRLLSTNDMRLIKHITSSIFHPLIYQSELGQDYQEKFDLWKKTNFVTGNIDDVDFDVQYEHEEGQEGEDTAADSGLNYGEKVFDPRAGQVDVVINEIRFDPLKIIEMFENNRFKPFVTSKGKKQMKMLVKQYKKLSEGIFPLGIQSMESIDKKDYAVDIDEQIDELENYQKELVGEKVSVKRKRKELAKLKAKKEQSTKSAKSSESNVWTETNETLEAMNQKPADTTNTKKKTRKKTSKMQIKEEKLKKLKIKRDAKLEAIRQQKLATKSSKMPKVIPENKQEDSAQPKSGDNATPNKQIESRSNKQKGAFEVKDEWSEPLKEGETEYFIPSRKNKLKEVNKRLKEKAASPSEPASQSKPSSLVKNPFATPKNLSKLKRSLETPQTDGPTEKKKRVKIALNKNIFQDLHQHIQQVKSSPQLPYDSSKKPPKGALKPNLMPSPINPFYRKKIGLKLNETL